MPDTGVEEFDLRRSLEIALRVAADFEGETDPFRGEFLAAEMLTPGYSEDNDIGELFGAWHVLMLEMRATPSALGLLRGISWLTGGELSRAARVAADRVQASGVAVPPWAARLDEPLRPIEFTCSRAADHEVLMGSFERAGDIHGFLVCVGHRDKGVADQIVLCGGDESAVEPQRGGAGLPGITERLAPHRFRRRLESALDRRARLDRAEAELGLVVEADPDADLPPHAVTATVLRAHLRAIASKG
ncbi:hypothetical protein VMT65_18195 [Nocardia sp. CDC153]|uniref:hypothetical protein n=1 Tax=Nocardia sp. CDC153 TaxID=3112167 RepID=UPI002DC02F9B|nr:hypothetical protein [Nocardia sp. CDC153]MEC3954978.1 hypothetical protein [Nocardia sp. CDC153]